MLYRDGFPHLIRSSIQIGRPPMLLTPVSFMVEQMTLTPDRRFAIYNANTGSTQRPRPPPSLQGSCERCDSNALTGGAGIEWTRPLRPMSDVAFPVTVARSRQHRGIALSGGTTRPIAVDRLPSDFPTAQLVHTGTDFLPRSDGVEAHGQLSSPPVELPGNRLWSTFTVRPPARCCSAGIIAGIRKRLRSEPVPGESRLIVLSVDYRLSRRYGRRSICGEHGARAALQSTGYPRRRTYLQARTECGYQSDRYLGRVPRGYLTRLRSAAIPTCRRRRRPHGVHDSCPQSIRR